MRVSRECRETFANDSCDNRMSKSPFRSDRNVIMVAMSYFCRQNVSQISLEKVANCSHPSEILALTKRFTKKGIIYNKITHLVLRTR